MMEHTSDCTGGPGECAPETGTWDQPLASYVEEATIAVGDDAPWCQIRDKAWKLQKPDHDDNEWTSQIGG